MGFMLAQLFVSVNANTKGFDLGMSKVKVSAMQVKKSLAGLSKFAKTMFVGMSAAIAGVVAIAGSYEKSMARIKAVTGATAQEFGMLDKVIRDLGITTIFSAKEIADAARFLAIAGFSNVEIMESLPAVMDLAAAGAISVESAADIAAKTMRGMGISAGQLRDTVDIMSKAFTSANTDVRQFGDALTYVGPIARFSSISLNQVGAAILVVSDAGIQAERAGTGLRRFLAELSRQASPAKDAMRKMGIQVMDTGGQIRPIPDIIRELTKAFEEQVPEAQKLGKLIEIFGLRAGPAVAAMMADGGKKMAEFEKMLAKAGGTAKVIADIQMKTLFGRLKQVRNAVFDLGISFGKMLIPVIEVAIGAFRNMALWLSALPASTKMAIGAFLVFGTALFGVAVGLISIIGLMGIITAHPIIAVITALLALSIFIWQAVTAGDTLKEKLTNMWSPIQAAISSFVAFVQETFGQIIASLAPTVEWIRTEIPNSWAEALELIQPIIEDIKSVIVQAWETIRGIISTVSLAILGITLAVWNAIGKEILSVMTFIGGVIKKTWDWVIANIQPVLDFMVSLVVHAFGLLTFAIKEWQLVVRFSLLKAGFFIVRFANQVIHFFTDVIPSVLSWFSDNWIEIFTNLAAFTATVFTNMGKNIGNFFDSLLAALKGEGFEFAWIALDEGFKSTIEKWPEFAKRKIGDLEKVLGDEADAAGKEMNKKFSKHMDKFVSDAFKPKKALLDVGSVPDAVKADLDGANKEAGEAVGKNIGKKAAFEIKNRMKNFPVFRGIEQLGRNIQKSALKTDMVQAQQLEQLKQINKNIKANPNPVFNPVVGD